MIGFFYWIPLVVIIIYLWHKWNTRHVRYFEKIGLPYRKPAFLFGDILALILKRRTFLDFLTNLYYSYPNERVVGTFDFTNPVFFLRDPELIRKITIKDFDHFTDRQNFDSSNELFSKFLSLLKGQKWKDMRATLSPAFTGSKMRQMFELINDCADQLSKHFLESGDSKHIVDVSDVFSRFTNDSIATCAFGIKINSLTDRDNEFFKFGQTFVKPNFALMMAKFMLMRLAPRVARLCKVQFLSEEIDTFFRSLIIDTMKIRDEQNIYRPDMIHLLMQVRKGGIKDDDEKSVKSSIADTELETVIGAKAKTDWTDDELVAQCLLFFFAGFSTTAGSLTFLSYELAMNPEVQQKLIEEIDETERKNPGGLTYSMLQSMKYLDMVISENLRKWTPAPVIERICIKDYAIYDNDNRFRFNIEKGRSAQISVYSLHRDAQYFPDPGRFDPERFSDANIEKIVPGTYLPFGAGPRNCIASRFALMKMKILVYNLLKSFTVEVCEKTEVPLKLSGFFLVPDKGVFLELRKRSK